MSSFIHQEKKEKKNKWPVSAMEKGYEHRSHRLAEQGKKKANSFLLDTFHNLDETGK